MTRLILSTSNVMSSGSSVVRRNIPDKSNLELVSSLKGNFVAAQEDHSPPITDGKDGHQDYAQDEHLRKPPSSIWTTRTGSDYYIPTIDWSLSGLVEERSQYDITVKLFFLQPGGPEKRSQYARDAVELVLKELGVGDVDLLIVSFPGLSFDGDCEWEADMANAEQGNDDEEIASWPIIERLYTNGTVKKLGIAEYGSQKLARFVSSVKVPPVVDQINVKDCCNVPPPLIEYAKKQRIELLTHSDCTNVLPSGTLRRLLGQGADGAGVLSESKRGLDGMKGELTSQWVVKYTAVIRDRGVIENKGYFAAADLQE